jgi:hypothetical protein
MKQNPKVQQFTKVQQVNESYSGLSIGGTTTALANK